MKTTEGPASAQFVLRSLRYALLILVVAFLSAPSMNRSPPRPSPRPVIQQTKGEETEDTIIRATAACRIAALEEMRDPDSAKWDIAKDMIGKTDDGGYIVLLPVRGENAYGAMMQSSFGCRMTSTFQVIEVLETGIQGAAYAANGQAP